jgi:hypothetical protein
MEITTIIAGVLAGNFLTVGIMLNIRELDVPNPSLKNIVALLLFIGAALAVTLACAQSLSEVL